MKRSDWPGLPDLPGDAVLRLLREQQETAEVPMVVSADPDPRLGRWLVRDGASAYLTKPIDVARFRYTVDEALQGTRRRN